MMRTSTSLVLEERARGPMPAALQSAPARRGAAGIAMVALLIIVQLTVVGVVISGARDEDTNVQRLDTLRSFYATEGGMNMSIREFFRGSDDDGDGVVGTISNDGNPNNDPALGTARMSVSATSDGVQTTLTCAGRSGICRRQADAVMSGGPSLGPGSTQIMAVFGRNNTKVPRYSIWNGSSWGPNTAMPWSVSGNVLSVVGRACPTRDEIMFACADDAKDVTIAI